MNGGATKNNSADTKPRASVDREEVAKFTAIADAWWDPRGKFQPLHNLNPTRLAFIRDRVAERRGRNPTADGPLAGLRLLDIGCGGGLLSEPMARLGASVTGLDASERNIAIARRHAEESVLEIDYRAGSAEELADGNARFDIVLNMEVIEHVADRDAFLGACCKLLGDDGMMFIATLNRTPKAYALAIVGAEYVLGWLPRGTHDWNKFVRPSELAAGLRRHSVSITELTGVSYNPLADKWSLSRDLDVNYMAVAERK